MTKKRNYLPQKDLVDIGSLPRGTRYLDSYSKRYYVTKSGDVISDNGKLLSLLSIADHVILKDYSVVLCYTKPDGKRSSLSRKVKTLLAELYVPNPNKYKFVKSIDGNRSNISLDNLEWVATHTETISVEERKLLVEARRKKSDKEKVVIKFKLDNEKVIPLVDNEGYIEQKPFTKIPSWVTKTNQSVKKNPKLGSDFKPLK